MKILLGMLFGVLVSVTSLAQQPAEVPEEVVRYLEARKNNDGKPPVINPFSMKVGDIGAMQGIVGTSLVDYVVTSVFKDQGYAMVKATTPEGDKWLNSGPGGFYEKGSLQAYRQEYNRQMAHERRFAGCKMEFLLKTGGAPVAERPISSTDIYSVTEAKAMTLTTGAIRTGLVLEWVRRDRIDEYLKAESQRKSLEANEKAEAQRREAEAQRQEAAKQADAERANRERITRKLEAAKWRTWTDADGNSIGEAKFLKANINSVWLEQRDGSVIEVSKKKISESDLGWIKRQGWNKSSKNK